MSFEALKNEILREAKRESEAVEARLHEQQKALEERITAKARAMEERILEEAEAEGQKQARHLHQEMELTARSQVLTAKQQELEKTQRMLLEQLLGQDEAAQKKLLAGLLKLLPDTKGTIVPGEYHKDLLAGLVEPPYTLAKDFLPQQGGFVFQSVESEMDLTLAQLVAQLFGKERAAIAKILFG